MPLPNYRLLELSGPTLMGIKPAELFNVSNKMPTEQMIWRETEKRLTLFNEVVVLEVRGMKGKKQFFIYHKKVLDKVLSAEKTLDFLLSIGYPPAYCVESYVAVLLDSLCSDKEFPHELGIFLGYPLKDVLAFMGYLPLPLTCIKGWRYYGEKETSLSTYRLYCEARELFKTNYLM